MLVRKCWEEIEKRAFPRPDTTFCQSSKSQLFLFSGFRCDLSPTYDLNVEFFSVYCFIDAFFAGSLRPLANVAFPLTPFYDIQP
jgi:hypothetical protein